jgi:chromosome segregation ATPase
MLNLDTLSFKVDTSELNDAVSKLESLKNKIKQVNTELINANKLETDAKRQSIRVAKEAAVAEQAVEQAKLKTAKATADLEAAEKKAANAGQATVRVQKEVSEEAKKAVSVLERQQMILEFMAQGFSKGQASTMAYAKASGALADELKDLENVLKTQRTLMGTDPFDKSIGALQSLSNEYKVIKDVQRSYNEGLELSRKQMTELARDKLRLIEQHKIEGKSLTDLKGSLRELESGYVRMAKAENDIVASMSKADKATTDAGRANAYLDKELEKVRFAMQEVNQELNRGSANSLVRFQNALKASGKTAEEQKVLLDEYRASVEKLQTKTQKANSDYIVRAVAPQMTDIFVGLATGQSPLTILLQQGGQLGDQFTQAGIKAQDMSSVMIRSLANVGDTIKGDCQRLYNGSRCCW